MKPTNPMLLKDPTDAELNRAFAEKVAGWTWHDEHPRGYGWYVGDAKVVDADGSDMGLLRPLRFTTSADAVLPWLDKQDFWTAMRDDDGITVSDDHMDCNSLNASTAKTFALAAVLMLLRANGVGVEFTK